MDRNRRGRVVLVHRRLGAILMGGAMMVSAIAVTSAEEERRCRAAAAAAADAPPPGVLEANECFTVRGRLSVHDSAPHLRLWPIGAKRSLEVAAGGPGTELMPEGLREQVLWAAEEGQRVFGEFTVCPLLRAGVVRERSAGARQLICVEAASGLRLEEEPHGNP